MLARRRSQDLLGVREFLARDWSAAQDAKDAAWRKRRLRDPGAQIEVGDGLRRHVAATRAGWPSAADRRADLAAHRRLSRLMRRASGRAAR